MVTLKPTHSSTLLADYVHLGRPESAEWLLGLDAILSPGKSGKSQQDKCSVATSTANYQATGPVATPLR